MKNNNKYQLLIFDWDGTLSDSVALIVKSLQHAISTLELAPRTEQDLQGNIGLGMQETINRIDSTLDSEHRQQFIQTYHEHYLRYADTHISLFPKVREVIQGLYGQGYYLAVATGKSRKGLDRALHQSQLQPFIHNSRCADETFSKPHPMMLEELLDDFALEAKDAVMIGDSEHDLNMAENAGMEAVAVSYGAKSAADLRKREPVACIDCLSELLQYV